MILKTLQLIKEIVIESHILENPSNNELMIRVYLTIRTKNNKNNELTSSSTFNS